MDKLQTLYAQNACNELRTIRQLSGQSTTPISVDGIYGVETAGAVKELQRAVGATVDGIFGPSTAAHWRRETKDLRPELPNNRLILLRHILQIISRFEGDWDSINADGEYRGLFDTPSGKHPASGKYHYGLSFGFIQFNQNAGSLGRVLKHMHDRDPGRFESLFGPYHQELLDVTTAPRGDWGTDGRNNRTQPVGGHDLWDPFWVQKFKNAAEFSTQSQIHVAIEDYGLPAYNYTQSRGWEDRRTLAIVLDRFIQNGPAGARNMFSKFPHKQSGTRKVDQDEFRHMAEFYNKYRSRRWHHRVRKLYWMPEEELYVKC